MLEASVEDAVGKLIRELIRVAFVDGFRGEKESHLGCVSFFAFSVLIASVTSGSNHPIVSLGHTVTLTHAHTSLKSKCVDFS